MARAMAGRRQRSRSNGASAWVQQAAACAQTPSECDSSPGWVSQQALSCVRGEGLPARARSGPAKIAASRMMSQAKRKRPPSLRPYRRGSPGQSSLHPRCPAGCPEGLQGDAIRADDPARRRICRRASPVVPPRQAAARRADDGAFQPPRGPAVRRYPEGCPASPMAPPCAAVSGHDGQNNIACGPTADFPRGPGPVHQAGSLQSSRKPANRAAPSSDRQDQRVRHQKRVVDGNP